MRRRTRKRAASLSPSGDGKSMVRCACIWGRWPRCWPRNAWYEHAPPKDRVREREAATAF